MQYRADILALYGDLFEEAHGSLVKEAFAAELAGAGMGLRELARRGRALFSRGGARAARQATQTATQAAPAATQAAETVAARAPASAKAYEDALASFQRHVGLARPGAAAATAAPAAAPAAAAVAAEPAKKGLSAGTIAALGIPAAGLGGYMLGQPDQAKIDAERTRTRNIAFGAGTATGLTLPAVIRGIGSIANGFGGSPGFLPGAGY